MPYSDFSSGFSGNRTTITADQAISPDGTENAVEIVETTDAGTHYASNALTVTASVDYTLSVYVKQGSGSRSAILRTNFEGSDDYVIFDFSSETITETGSGTSNATSQDVGNGWYRIAFTYTQSADTGSGFIVGLSNSATPSSSLPSYTGDGSSSLFVYGAQFEEGSTPSSLIPTSGQQRTRAAESFTIPSANLPWPESNYIGSDLVRNGTFDTDSDWTKGTGWSIGSDVASCDGTQTAISNITQASSGMVTGKVYAFSMDVTRTAGTVRFAVFDGASGESPTIASSGTLEWYYVAVRDNDTVLARASADFVGSIDNFSIREIDPLAFSVAMDGRVTYANTSNSQEVRFTQWSASADDRVRLNINTAAVGRTGKFDVIHKSEGVQTTVGSSNTLYSPDVLVPFNVAARHGSTFVNGASNGVALTENTAVVSLPDLSSTDFELAKAFIGTIGTFRVWDKDITDDGLVEATNPSLEPSLSLTFEGTGTNSFVVNDWSE